MTSKTLQQAQEENRKAIIIANNPEAQSYEEALHDELGFNCVVFSKDNCYYEKILYQDEGLYWTEQSCAIGSRSDIEDPNQYKIIGKPLTLDRTLIALHYINYTKHFLESEEYIIDDNFISLSWDGIFIKWDLTKSTLEEQSEETQRQVNKLLTEA